MATDISLIPEIVALEARAGIIRIPSEIDVPFTKRIRRLVDLPVFRRLAKVSQLGLVSLVYPGATHSRFEHALGVYHIMLRFLRQLCRDPRFESIVTPHDAEIVILAGLLHDVGHWPFCHAIEDLRLSDVPRHEELASRFLCHGGELANLIQNDWGVDSGEVLELIVGTTRMQKSRDIEKEDQSRNHSESADDTGNMRLLASLISGPVDADKMDYLQRDSLHAGVPYGRHFDPGRLIGSLILNHSGDGLALQEKGKTAAELMVFARYVMFNEVYWHHTVRSATAMLARAFYELRMHLDLSELFHQTEESMIQLLNDAAGSSCWSLLLDGIFGRSRFIYKRLAQFSSFEQPEVYHQLAGKPYPWLVRCARSLCHTLADACHSEINEHEILIDAPPVQREVEFNVEIFFEKERCYRPLVEVSPVIRALAQQQFDDYVKRVRVFCHPRVVSILEKRGVDLTASLEAAAYQANRQEIQQ